MINHATDAPLELGGVHKRYRHHHVLDGLELRVARGEIVGLLGPNGCGKTTTLRIAAGYLWPDSGRVTVNGKAVTPDDPRSRASIGYLPERVPLYDPFTVDRQLRFVAGARGLRGAARQTAVDALLERFALAPVRQRVIGQLSKGYRQRIGLAQALLGEPQVLLLDEPMNGLDPLQLIEARRAIRAAARERAVVFSTHIMQEVEALCTRVVYLAAGKLVNVPVAAPASVAPSVEACLSSTGINALIAAVNALGAGLHVTDSTSLGADRFRLTIAVEGDAASRATLSRLLASNANLESLTPVSARFEQRLVEAIGAERAADEA